MVDFKSSLEEVREKRRKSDMENLAHAYDATEQEMARLVQLQTKIKETAALSVIPDGVVQKLYKEATGR